MQRICFVLWVSCPHHQILVMIKLPLPKCLRNYELALSRFNFAHVLPSLSMLRTSVAQLINSQCHTPARTSLLSGCPPTLGVLVLVMISLDRWPNLNRNKRTMEFFFHPVWHDLLKRIPQNILFGVLFWSPPFDVLKQRGTTRQLVCKRICILQPLMYIPLYFRVTAGCLLYLSSHC